MDGIDLIARERREQKKKHNITTKSDSRYKHNELLMLVEYLLKEDNDSEKYNLEDYLFINESGPMMSLHFLEKLKDKSRFNKLIIAGALIAAELDVMKYRLVQGPDESLPK